MRLRDILLIGFLICFSSLKAAEDYFPDRVFFKLTDASSQVLEEWPSQGSMPWEGPKEIANILNKYPVKRLFHPFKTRSETLDKVYQINLVDGTSRDALIQELSELSIVEYAEQVPYYKQLYTPNDLSGLQWALPKIDAELAWDQSKGSRGIVVAVVDDAVRITHNDLAPNVWVNTWEIPGNNIDDDGNGYVDDIHGYDVADDDNDPNPPGGAFSHGTHVAGIVSAATDNGTGIASIGFNVRIMAVKTKLDASVNDPGLEATMEGVDYAISARADVVNMSFGGGGISTTYQALFNAGHDLGIVFVAACGNDGASIPHYPSSYDNVISVGSTSFSDAKSGFSNYHPTVDVMAPGSSIYSTVATSDNAYSYMSGTSMASPLTAGLCALILSKNPGLDPDQVEACLESGCDNINSMNSSYVGQIGAGRINANNSLSCVSAPAIPVANFDVRSDTVCGSTIFFADSTETATDWLWDFGDGTSSTEKNPQHSYASSGNYDVTLIATNSSGTDTLVKSFWFELLPAYTVTAGPDTTACKGDTINLWVTPGATSYIWSPITGLQFAASDTAKAKVFGSVTYIVTATDSNGCEAADEVVITPYPDPPISAGADKTIAPGDSVLLSASGGVSYTWSPATGLSCTACANTWASPDSTIYYTLEGVGVTGCKADDIVLVEVIFVGIDDELPVEIRLFPNPASDRISLRIQTEFQGALNYRIVDLNGKAVASGSLNNGSNPQINTSNWAEGIYYFQVLEGKGSNIPLMISR